MHLSLGAERSQLDATRRRLHFDAVERQRTRPSRPPRSPDEEVEPHGPAWPGIIIWPNFGPRHGQLGGRCEEQERAAPTRSRARRRRASSAIKSRRSSLPYTSFVYYANTNRKLAPGVVCHGPPLNFHCPVRLVPEYPIAGEHTPHALVHFRSGAFLSVGLSIVAAEACCLPRNPRRHTPNTKPQTTQRRTATSRQTPHATHTTEKYPYTPCYTKRTLDAVTHALDTPRRPDTENETQNKTKTPTDIQHDEEEPAFRDDEVT